MKSKDEKWALFWCKLLHPIIFGEIEREQTNRFLTEYYKKTIPKSTLYRHLKLAGATRLKLGISQQKVRIRWTRDHTHDLWLGDFQEGPYVLVDGEVLPTNLCLFIDCHSRYVVEGRYYLKPISLQSNVTTKGLPLSGTLTWTPLLPSS